MWSVTTVSMYAYDGIEPRKRQHRDSPVRGCLLYCWAKIWFIAHSTASGVNNASLPS
jgi:hypothetical protein